ncbi:hypothetical protein CPLU01_11796 [Colletotrichum plurivorum]|uniref:Uncharacterized protein n=1 Tax=Colletotrichum plurivorum TaxID=2175906 RepID=A0A8H6N792_9PEZI|nr:hypothetical protein CPLU01_11796 [Colletotrichum plurivorum]
MNTRGTKNIFQDRNISTATATSTTSALGSSLVPHLGTHQHHHLERSDPDNYRKHSLASGKSRKMDVRIIIAIVAVATIAVIGGLGGMFFFLREEGHLSEEDKKRIEMIP